MPSDFVNQSQPQPQNQYQNKTQHHATLDNDAKETKQKNKFRVVESVRGVTTGCRCSCSGREQVALHGNWWLWGG